MIDLKFLRENPDAVRESQRTRGEDPALVDALLEADASRRAAVLAGDNLRAEQKAFGKKVGQASPEERPALLEGAKELAAKVKQAEAEQHEAQAALDAAHRAISNVVQEGVPRRRRGRLRHARDGRRHARRSTSNPRTTSSWVSRWG